MSPRKRGKIIFNKVSIIGVGLLGGSIGLCLKREKIASRVTGFFRKRESAKKAKALHIVDQVTFDIFQAVKDADLVILATPVSVIKQIAPKIVKGMKKGAFLMDVGSTKKEIVDCVEKAATKAGVYFVGVHPLAGSEKSGLIFSRKDLFEGTVCFITPGRLTHKLVLSRVKEFWQALGSKVFVVNPKLHDHIVALVSHLPHMVSFALMRSVPEQFLAFSGSGLRDCTRLASSESEIWRDICSSNSKEISAALRRFKQYLSNLEKLINKKDWQSLQKFLLKAKLIRDNL